jgi:hypothetical protein
VLYPGPALELRLSPFGGSPGADELAGVLVAALVGLTLFLVGLFQQSPAEVVFGLLPALAAIVALVIRRRARLVVTPAGLLTIRNLPPPTLRSLRLDRLAKVHERRWRPPFLRRDRHGWTWLVLTAGERSVSVHLGWWADEAKLLAVLAWWVAQTSATVDDAAARRLVAAS